MTESPRWGLFRFGNYFATKVSLLRSCFLIYMSVRVFCFYLLRFVDIQIVASRKIQLQRSGIFVDKELHERMSAVGATPHSRQPMRIALLVQQHLNDFLYSQHLLFPTLHILQGILAFLTLALTDDSCFP